MRLQNKPNQLRSEMSIRLAVGQERGRPELLAEGEQGVGGSNTSNEIGERYGTRTRWSKEGPCQ